MGLRFILGRAGTGKTRYIMDQISREAAAFPMGRPIVLMVPEQATFQAEYSLAVNHGLNGAVRAQVLSFRRLAHRVLLETGGAARIPIGDLGKRMVLRELLARYQHQLKVFGRHTEYPGFTDRLAGLIGELKTYTVCPADMVEAAMKLSGTNELLAGKLTDVAFIFSELDSYLSGRYTDPDDYLRLLAEKLDRSAVFRGATFWIDGFKDFTPQEMAVVEKIMRISGEVNIALCLDAKCTQAELDEGHFFFPTWQTYQKIRQIAEDNRIEILAERVLAPEVPPRYGNTADLAHVEKHFYSYPAPEFADRPKNISIVAGANRRAEVEACARRIVALARDSGFRWRDMAVLLRDLEPYHELIAAVFTDYEIPFFIDRKRNVMHHPVVELIRSALEAVSRDWAYEPVLRFLKTDLVPVSREQVFLLENYVLAHGIRGAKWTDPADWTYWRRYTLGEDAEKDNVQEPLLAMINQVRREAVRTLADFAAAVGRARNVRDLAGALYKLLDDLNVAARIDAWRAEEESAGNPEQARQHAQVWKALMALFDEVVAALGDVQMSVDTFAGVLDAGLESLTLGMIPPGLDQVVIGSLDRTRNPEVKALFVLGASEGVLPARPQDNSIFNDREREKLSQVGIDLAPAGRRRVFEEQFLVYVALTRASCLLWLSYPMTDDDGRPIAVSPVVTRLKELFPALRETVVSLEPVSGDNNESLEFVVHPRQALACLNGRLREAKAGRPVSPVWWDVYNWFVADEHRRDVANILRSVFHTNDEAPVTANIGRILYGRPMRASVSRIELYRACPFAFFSRYGLRLREREVYRLEAPDMGEFFHAALQMFAESLAANGIDWGQLSPEDCARISGQIVDHLAPQLQNEILFSTARYRYIAGKLKKTVNRAVVTLAEHARRGTFRPVGLELAFGPGGRLPPLTIAMPSGEIMELCGRIDRLDAVTCEEGLYLRVIDYKSGDNTLSLEDIYHGLKIQLLAYLHVALNYYAAQAQQECRPGGILYFTVKEPLLSSKGPLSREEAAKAMFARLKMRGFLLADTRVLRMMDNLIDRGGCELLPVRLRKDGTVYSNAPVITEELFTVLRSYLEKLLAESGQEILQGRIDIAPFKKGDVTACRYCVFLPVCKFDPGLEGNRYRRLPAVPRDKIWDLLRGKEVSGEQQQMD